MGKIFFAFALFALLFVQLAHADDGVGGPCIEEDERCALDGTRCCGSFECLSYGGSYTCQEPPPPCAHARDSCAEAECCPNERLQCVDEVCEDVTFADLAVDFPQPFYVRGGTQRQFPVIIMNNGMGTARNFDLEARANAPLGMEPASQRIRREIEGGEHIGVEVATSCPQAQQLTEYRATISATNVQNEWNEGDNTMAATVWCIPNVDLVLSSPGSFLDAEMGEIALEATARNVMPQNGYPVDVENIVVRAEPIGGFAIDDTSETIARLESGGSVTVRFYGRCPGGLQQRQTYGIRILLDATEIVPEAHENNNIVEVDVVCEPVQLSVRSVSAQPKAAGAGEQVAVSATIGKSGAALFPAATVRASVTGSPAIAPAVATITRVGENVDAGATFTITCPAVNAYTTYIVTVGVDGYEGTRTGAFGCAGAQVERICRAEGEGGVCSGCGAECRARLLYVNPQSAQYLYSGKSALCVGNVCADANCLFPCTKEIVLPNSEQCLPYDAHAADTSSCRRCNYDCRVLNNSEVPPQCDTQEMQGTCLAASCADECKVELGKGMGEAPPVCMPYLGNGAGENPDLVPIALRSAPYNNAADCRQCPEQCRIRGDGKNCDLEPANYDCSLQSCTNECRTIIPPVQQLGTCRQFISGECMGCPLECRLLGADVPDATARCARCAGCSQECKASVPDTACGGYASCSEDCFGSPQIRTDCSDLCSQEELTGPSRISPASFITKIGGAEGESLTKNVGTLMLPAIVLPLFNIVILLAFIRVLSPVLGGDVEIPGIARLI